MWAMRMEAKVGSVFASPILVSIGCGRSNDLASLGAMFVGFLLKNHLALLIDV
jgi:hypothetical protein